MNQQLWWARIDEDLGNRVGSRICGLVIDGFYGVGDGEFRELDFVQRGREVYFRW